MPLKPPRGKRGSESSASLESKRRGVFQEREDTLKEEAVLTTFIYVTNTHQAPMVCVCHALFQALGHGS